MSVADTNLLREFEIAQRNSAEDETGCDIVRGRTLMKTCGCAATFLDESDPTQWRWCVRHATEWVSRPDGNYYAPIIVPNPNAVVVLPNEHMEFSVWATARIRGSLV